MPRTVGDLASTGSMADPERTNPANQRKTSDNSGTDEPVCRICYRGVVGPDDPLLAPCSCKGTMRLVHKACLERCLQCRQRDQCNVCLYQFQVVRKSPPLRKYFSGREHRHDTCLMFVNLVSCVGDVMVVVFAWMYALSVWPGLSSFVCLLVIPGLVIQTIFWLILDLLRSWISYEPIRQWRQQSTMVHVVMGEPRGPATSSDLAAAEDGAVPINCQTPGPMTPGIMTPAREATPGGPQGVKPLQVEHCSWEQEGSPMMYSSLQALPPKDSSELPVEVSHPAERATLKRSH